MKQTQREKILDFLQSGGKLTRLSALRDFGVIELPARICELKKEGIDLPLDALTIDECAQVIADCIK